jgi:hypothetical protein
LDRQSAKENKMKAYRRTKLLMVTVLLTTCLMLAGAAQAAVTWSNQGQQSLLVNSNFYPPSMQRYVAPGAKIVFDVGEIIEKDSQWDCGVKLGEYDDPEKQGRLRKSGGTCPGTWSVTFSSTGRQTYTVPTDPANIGKTIIIVAELHDTRPVVELRHDEWSTHGTWSFIISADCPESMSASMIDKSGTRPNPGETYGAYWAIMAAVGTPPAGRSNWNGTTVTEAVGPAVGNPAEWAPGVIGSPDTSGSTFTFGTYVNDQQQLEDNKFRDMHSTNSPTLTYMAAGVNQASYTRAQVYTCKATKTYSFTITRTGTRLDAGGPNERVKISITK